MPIPEFIAELRSLVGTHPLLLVAATGVVLREGPISSEVLLVRLADGYWSPPAGIVEPGEQPHDAAVREVSEESGVTCRVRSLSWVFAGPLVVFNNGDQARHVELVFRCDFAEGDPRPDNEETFAAGWWSLEGLPEMQPHHLERVLIAAKGLDRTTLGTNHAALNRRV